MGAMESLRWQSWHFSWKIGAMSLAKVTGLLGSLAIARLERITTTPIHLASVITRSFNQLHLYYTSDRSDGFPVVARTPANARSPTWQSWSMHSCMPRWHSCQRTVFYFAAVCVGDGPASSLKNFSSAALNTSGA